MSFEAPERIEPEPTIFDKTLKVVTVIVQVILAIIACGFGLFFFLAMLGVI